MTTKVLVAARCCGAGAGQAWGRLQSIPVRFLGPEASTPARASFQTPSAPFSSISAISAEARTSISSLVIISRRSAASSIIKNMVEAARPLVICGPSGVGKSTIVKRLTDEFPDVFGFSVSHTTRKPREGELDGVNYHYVDDGNFKSAVDRGEFIEWAQFSGNLYGTSRGAVSSVQLAGRICILDIEMQGVKQLKKNKDMKPHFVFIKPPTMEELERRLRDRKTESEESIQKRLDTARKEMEYASDPQNFDLIIVNDDLDKAAKELRDFMIGYVEELKKYRAELAKQKP